MLQQLGTTIRRDSANYRIHFSDKNSVVGGYICYYLLENLESAVEAWTKGRADQSGGYFVTLRTDGSGVFDIVRLYRIQNHRIDSVRIIGQLHRRARYCQLRIFSTIIATKSCKCSSTNEFCMTNKLKGEFSSAIFMRDIILLKIE
jgi:hypothetical protein